MPTPFFGCCGIINRQCLQQMVTRSTGEACTAWVANSKHCQRPTVERTSHCFLKTTYPQLNFFRRAVGLRITCRNGWKSFGCSLVRDRKISKMTGVFWNKCEDCLSAASSAAPKKRRRHFTLRFSVRRAFVLRTHSRSLRVYVNIYTLAYSWLLSTFRRHEKYVKKQ